MDCVIYENIPANFNPVFETAVCFLEYQKMFLMLLRQDHKPFGNTWCLPGGKKDAGETLLDCVVRETCEETGVLLDTKSIIFLKTVYVQSGDLQYVYHMFSCVLPAQIKPLLRVSEHKDFIWVTPIDALKMTLIPGQDLCLRLIFLT